MESTLFLASLYLGTALVVVPLAVRMGLGSVLGYLGAGIILGPVLGLAGETNDLQHMAEIGVVMMLFLIGLELAPRSIWDMRHTLLGLGGVQVVATCLVIAGLLVAWGLAWQTALLLGMVLSLSSTAIALQSLTEKNLMRSRGGRFSFSVLLAQDIAVVPMLALIPILVIPAVMGTPDIKAEPIVEGAAEPLISFMQSLPGWGATLVTLGIVAGIILAGHFLSRPVFRFVHASRLPEMSTCMSLLMVLGITFLMMLVGLSPALGTFVAGVVLANSEFRHQIEADLKPFKGLLLGLFFMTVGMGINFQAFAAAPTLIIGATLALIATKALVLFVLGTAAGLRSRDRWLFALGLAQAGEFGFLLVSFARSEDLLSLSMGQTTSLVISLSMLFSPILFLLYDRIARRGADTRAEPDHIDAKGRVIIAGIGRFGQTVNRLVRSSGIDTVVLDSDITIIETMRKFGFKGFYGDPTRPELLAAAGLADAEVLVVAVDDRAHATAIVRHARRERPDLHIVARARDRVHVYELYQAGANDIVRETFDSSVRAGRYVLENTGFSEYEASRMSQTFYRVDRAAMRDMAELWVPGQAVHLNDAYIARAKQLDRDLETALIEDLDEVRPKATAAE
jgi:monovalent cation:H+ antiporter-2, CPA2 family